MSIDPLFAESIARATRRDLLLRAGGGFGAAALAWLLNNVQPTAASETGEVDFLPVASPASAPHRRPLAQHIIFLFMEGGPSHIDLFDPKPTLDKLAGQPLPASFGPLITAMGELQAPLLASRRRWQRHGQSGLWISDWLPNIAQHADELCVVRSVWADGLNHVGSVCQMNTCSVNAGRPSLGSWVNYGLGTENANLPAFVVLSDSESLPLGGQRNWGAGFMPSVYAGTMFKQGAHPIPHLRAAEPIDARVENSKRALWRTLNRRHAASRADRDDLDSRIATFELAFRMQSEAAEAVDLAAESPTTFAMYGLGDEKTQSMGRSCLLARRLVERGVRFVQVYCGAGSKWDAHTQLEKNHSQLCRASDRPVAALLADLKQRGLLDETLVVWGGEFGRTPMSEKGNGRDHNPYGFTMWLAGGGVRGGQTVGSTDEIGLRAADRPIHVRDLHATLLYALGVRHLDLHYAHNGRRETPTINDGDVVQEIFA